MAFVVDPKKKFLGTEPWQETFQGLGRIKYNGLVNLGDLFRTVRGWFNAHKYLFVEKTMKHKTGGEGVEKEYEWQAKKKVYDYLEYTVITRFKVKNAVDVEVIKDGQKQKLSQCSVVIEIDGVLKYDPLERFGKSLFGKNLQRIYHRFFARKDIIFSWVNDFENSIRDLQKVITVFLNYESTITA
ncbi:MAG TPA: hypothetical protein VJH22_04095 [Candidatus Nanoarchaeia archaeon]|nr:hypothetical protein [Candidatus Nanoarchaeia archaeon]